jgi:tRNA pseudouridine38-40 synthase
MCDTESDFAEASRSYALTIAYDGTRFAGWQIQPNGLAIQQVLSDSVSRVVKHPIQVQGSGRTDAGVHAIGQVGAFKSNQWRAPADRLIQAINGYLPRDIVVLKASEVVPGFDPIRHAISKRYRYTLRNSRVPDPLRHSQHWWITRPLSLEAMRSAASLLVGTHDFKAFESMGSNRKTSTRTVREITIVQVECLTGFEIYIEMEADGFLYNMVRNIAGALVQVGLGRFGSRWIQSVLESRTRDSSSQTAPARGLCLINVQYPSSVYISD